MPRRLEGKVNSGINQLGEEPSAAKEQSKRKEETEDNEEESVEWNPRRWRRWMRVVFAGWVQGTGEGDRGVEFEVWAGGVREMKSDGEG